MAARIEYNEPPINYAKAPKVLNYQDDVFCCGISKIGGFYGKEEALTKEIEEALKGTATMTLASVTSSQQIGIKALEANGFKRLASFKNRNTGNKVHLYGHVKGS